MLHEQSWRAGYYAALLQVHEVVHEHEEGVTLIDLINRVLALRVPEHPPEETLPSNTDPRQILYLGPGDNNV